MDRAVVDPADIRRGLAEDPEGTRALLRRMVDESHGQLAEMARMMGRHPTRFRWYVWRILELAGLLDYRRAAQRRSGSRVHERGFGQSGWLTGFNAR